MVILTRFSGMIYNSMRCTGLFLLRVGEAHEVPINMDRFLDIQTDVEPKLEIKTLF